MTREVSPRMAIALLMVGGVSGFIVGFAIRTLLLTAVIGVAATAALYVALVTFVIAMTGAPAVGSGRERALIYVSRVIWWGLVAVLCGAGILALLGPLPVGAHG